MADNKPVPIEQSQVPQPFNTSDKNSPYQGVINVPSSFNVSDSSNNSGEINRKKYFEINLWKLRFQYLIIIFTFLVIIYDITLQIVFDFVNIFAMMDNIIVILLISRLLVICLNRINFHSKRQLNNEVEHQIKTKYIMNKSPKEEKENLPPPKKINYDDRPIKTSNTNFMELLQKTCI